MSNKKDNVILNKTFEFSCEIIDFNKKLIEGQQYQLAKQLIRSGTSIGANVREAQRAESKADFIHKLAIALKEADETKYWLELIDKKVFAVDEKIKKETEEIISILVAIINSSRKN